jgi:LemA protein
MRRGTFIFAILIAAGAFFAFAFSKRNAIIGLDEAANRAWANVESAYQRRLDLIPNLVETAKGATRYEGPALQKITEARNQLLGLAREARGALAERDPERVDALDASLMASVRAFTGLATEAYPQLKATDQFTALQAELAGTENRINVARRDYNEAVAALNTAIRQWSFLPLFPGVKTREPFKAQPGAAEAPKVKFE